MGKFIKGDVVVIPFPFTDLTGNKKRPAFVVANLPGDDIIVCQITSKKSNVDSFALPLDAHNFESGSLPIGSFIRPNKIFTADKNIILTGAGHLSEDKTREVLDSIIAVINS
jgi:mRNA interferase MazF